MLCVARIEIHDNRYDELHPRMETAQFFQKFTDGSNGKKCHALPGMYVSTYYTIPALALLSATAAAFQVDWQAQIMLIAEGQILSHGCREEEPHSLANIISLLANSNAPSPLSGLFDFCSNNQGNSTQVTPIPVSEIFGTLK